MEAAALWQQSISENLAASTVPGHKKQQVSFESLHAGALGALSHQPEASPKNFVQPGGKVNTDFSQGLMKPTGVKTDLAVQGKAFFEVQLPDGSSAYTRDGEFHLSDQGQLVTKDGFPVAADGGSLQFDARNSGAVSVAVTGEVSQGGDKKGKIKLTDFNDPSLLSPMGAGYFKASDPKLRADPATTSTLRQGFLETSNTSVVEEMTHLISAMRSFEANQKVVQMHDERMSKAISELAPPS